MKNKLALGAKFPLVMPRRGGLPVIKVSEFKLYELAIAVHPLTTVPEHAKYSDVWYAWFTARTELQTLFHHRQLNFCYEAANKLYNAITVVVPTEWQEAFRSEEHTSELQSRQ